MTATISALGNAVLDLEYRNGTAEVLHRAQLQANDTLLADAAEQRQRRQVLTAALGQPEAHSGGSVANSLSFAAAVGVHCTLMSIVGNDPEGRRYREDLSQESVHLLSPKDATGQTANCLVVITTDGERTMSTSLGCCLNIDAHTPDAAAIGNSDWLLLEGYCIAGEKGQQAVLAAQKAARDAGVRVALTLSSEMLVRANRQFVGELAAAGLDLLIGNEAEAQAAADEPDTASAMAVLARQTPLVAITLAQQGAQIAADGNSWHQPTTPVRALDALGAGDAFAGALLAALALGHDIRTAAQWGCRAGTAQVGCHGPRMSQDMRQQLVRHFTGE